jgi:hypothetical protein
MNDPQADQAVNANLDDDTRFGRISLTIAKCIWGVVLTVVAAYYVLYWISWRGLFFAGILFVFLIPLVPIVSALGVYFGVKGMDALDDRDALIGLALNAAACVGGAILWLIM